VAAPDRSSPAIPLETVDRTRDNQTKSAHTRRAYRADWRHFTEWCETRSRQPLPAAPETLVDYLTDLAGTYKVSSINRRLCAISQTHQAAEQVNPAAAPTVRALMAGLRRSKVTAPASKRPVLLSELRKMITTLPDTPCGLRNRALLLVGFAGAFRRSELVALDWADIVFGAEGLTITLRGSASDSASWGRKVSIPFGSRTQQCPVQSLAAWREAAGTSSGPVFCPIDRQGKIGAGRLSDKAVARIVKRAAGLAGLDPNLYAGHSLRSGLATAAAMGGASERSIMDQTGHRSIATVRRYIRDGSLLQPNASDKTGL
jgi:site-specific recombinase XerD